VATAAGAVAIPLYLLTPRSGFDKLELGQPRVEIGYAADQMIDLNHTGELAVNPAPAFAVWATEGDGRPKEDLNPDQRWRGAALAAYDKGVWRRTVEVEFPEVAAMAARVSAWSPPDLGPGRYRLTFSVPTRLTGQFLADPVSWAAGQPSPVVELGPGGPQRPWYPRPDGSFLRTERSSRQGQAHYAQFRSPAQDSDLGPGFELRREGSRILTTNPIPRVKEYADAVLAELVREGRLPPAARALNAVRLLPADEYHEAIARAFTEYLAGRAGLAYTTDLPPVPKGMDPIEHFLFHSRAGHCERFAAALCFMLRSQGIPAAVVLGFKGCDHLGGGRYEVRQEHAHAWVEALISRPADPAPGRVWHWLSLDPTPTQGASGGGIGAGGPDSWFDRGRTAFNRYVLHYTEKDREQTLHDAADWLTSPALSGTVGGLVLLVVGAIVWRRRAAAPPSPPVTESGRWIDRLLALLAAHGFAIRPGETVREFATGTAQALHARGVPAALAGVPVEWAAAYYTTRFGGTPIPPDRLAELEDGLAALRRALADHPGGGS
jgi:transglutaminase-like putative cysteine protease